VAGVATAEDRVARQFHRDQADELWVTDVTEHPTRDGKVCCAVVLDAWSRRVIGLSIDGSPTTALVTSALGMAIDQRQPNPKHNYSQRPGHSPGSSDQPDP
jgi:putative transposase